MRILARSSDTIIIVVTERQLASFANILLLLNLLVYALGLYALIEAQRQSYLLLYISSYLLRLVWPSNSPKISTKYYRSYIAISMVRAFKILKLKVYGDNSNSNILTYRSITLKHFRLKVFIGQTFWLTK
jgi:hypothetical protein